MSDFILHDLLHLRKSTFITRYGQIFLSFLISGVMHFLGEVGVGFPVRDSGTIQFFLLQAVGIMLEDGVQAIYRYALGIRRNPGSQPQRWARVVGYVWVLGFMTWSTPIWFYPRLRQMAGDEREMVLPFSLLQLLRGQIRGQLLRTGPLSSNL